MLTVRIEHIGEVSAYIGLGLEIVTAIFLGGAIGLDRERKMKAAGVKTNMLICLGATLYTAVSLLIHHNIGPATADPNRIAAQIVSGIGFLGAGAIIQGKGSVIGLTTAATIWVVAAVGVTIGAGYPVIAALFTLTVLLVLWILNPLYKILGLRTDYFIRIRSQGSVKKILRKRLGVDEAYIRSEDETLVDKEMNIYEYSLMINLNPKRFRTFMLDMESLPNIEKINYDKDPELILDKYQKANKDPE